MCRNFVCTVTGVCALPVCVCVCVYTGARTVLTECLCVQELCMYSNWSMCTTSVCVCVFIQVHVQYLHVRVLYVQ